MTKTKHLGLISLLLIVSCSHGGPVGKVAMKVSETEAHVTLGQGKVQTGDTIAVFKNVCTRNRFLINDAEDLGNGECIGKKIGTGTVERILNDRYSLVKMSSVFPFEEGMVVERQ